MDITTIHTTNERIAARWERIEARRQRKNAQSNGRDSKEEEGVEITNISQTKIKESRRILDTMKFESRRKITEIRLLSDEREKIRRQEEKKLTHHRANLLTEENIRSEKIDTLIDNRWSEITTMKNPQQIACAISEQEDECAKVLQSKNMVISELEEQMRVKHDEYIEMLKTQESDVSLLLQRMHEQFASMRQEYGNQLTHIENAFLEERHQILEKNKKEIDELFEQRRALEIQILDAKIARDAKFQKELDELRLRDTDDYNKLKISLENNIQLLEQQLEEMRSTYQLNTEKLNYNFQVLKEREKENMDTIDHQKRKLKRLASSLTTLKHKYAENDKTFKAENQNLTDEYKRITRQYKELQLKFRHFERVDSQKYEDIWAMNHEDILEQVHKVLQADKIIHEQILGLPWTPPDKKIFSYHQDKTIADNINTDGEEVESIDQTMTADIQSVSSDSRVKKVLDSLVVEASFLVDRQLKESISSLPESEQRLHEADAILKILGVEDREDLDEIVSLFFADSSKSVVPPQTPTAFSSTTGATPSETSSQSDVEETQENCMVHPNDFVKVIRKYVASKQAKNAANGLRSTCISSGKGERNDGVEKTREKSERKRKKDKEFWSRLGNVIDEKKLRVWNALERSLKKYNEVLEERGQLVEETNDLRDENSRLKMILKQYLSSKINEELTIPPTHVLDFPNL